MCFPPVHEVRDCVCRWFHAQKRFLVIIYWMNTPGIWGVWSPVETDITQAHQLFQAWTLWMKKEKRLCPLLSRGAETQVSSKGGSCFMFWHHNHPQHQVVLPTLPSACPSDLRHPCYQEMGKTGVSFQFYRWGLERLRIWSRVIQFMVAEVVTRTPDSFLRALSPPLHSTTSWPR